MNRSLYLQCVFSRTGPEVQFSGAIAIFTFALMLRLAFALLVRDTYDYDEFVLLLLGRDYAHGAVPYAQFMFFHPPGALVLLRAIAPLTSLWWPTARVFMLGVDACTAALVYRIACRLFDRRVGMVAGLLYASSPLSLISAVRVGQDPLITFLLALGIVILLERSSQRAAIVAGICFAAAVWVKYPSLAFLPAYLVLARGRSPALLAGLAVGLIVLLLPFHAELQALYHQTVQFQRTRWKMPLNVRLETVALWWLLISPLAVLSLRSTRPLWLKVGFLTGAVFLLASQVYYHYYVPVLPFACVLAAPLAARMIGMRARVAVGAALLVCLAWAWTLDRGGPSPLYVTAAHLSDVRPTVRILDARTTQQEAVLADRFEYQYLAHRPALDDYFWNVGVLVNARYLEIRAPKAGAVVMSYGASSGFPTGFSQWMDRHYHRIDTGSTTVWLPRMPLTTTK